MTMMNLRITGKQVMGPNSIDGKSHKIRDSIHVRNQVWNLVDPPEGMKPIERKWIYKETDVDVYIY